MYHNKEEIHQFPVGNATLRYIWIRIICLAKAFEKLQGVTVKDASTSNGNVSRSGKKGTETVKLECISINWKCCCWSLSLSHSMPDRYIYINRGKYIQERVLQFCVETELKQRIAWKGWDHAQIRTSSQECKQYCKPCKEQNSKILRQIP